MNKCKYCQAELAENGKFCPVCGKDNSETEVTEETVVCEEPAVCEEPVVQEAAPEAQKSQPKPKASPAKIAMAVVAVVVLAAMLIALLVSGLSSDQSEGGTIASEPTNAVEETVAATIPADGNPDDETCKGSYTASDEEVIANGATVVASIGDNHLTNAELQVYYWLEVQSFLTNYGSYVSGLGLDYTQPLDTQICALSESGTWQQFFLASALHSWQNYQSMALEADEAGFELSAEDQEYLDTMEQTLEDDALSYGFENAKAMLEYNVGPGAEIADYIHFNQVYYRGYKYYEQLCNAIEVTEEEMEEHFLNNEADYTENGITQEDKYVDVRHILVMPETDTTDENGNATSSEEAWAACQQKAQEILDLWLAGEKTEDSFAALANEHTADGNDADYDGVPDGGLYTNVYKGQMVEPFENWCFDEARVSGDTGLVQTTYGWHVMYYVDSRPVWKTYAENMVLGEKIDAMILEITEKHPMTVDYSAILLGYVDLNG